MNGSAQKEVAQDQAPAVAAVPEAAHQSAPVADEKPNFDDAIQQASAQAQKEEETIPVVELQYPESARNEKTKSKADKKKKNKKTSESEKVDVTANDVKTSAEKEEHSAVTDTASKQNVPVEEEVATSKKSKKKNKKQDSASEEQDKGTNYSENNQQSVEPVSTPSDQRTVANTVMENLNSQVSAEAPVEHAETAAEPEAVAVEASVSESQPESAEVQSAEQVKEVSAEAPVEHAETVAEPEAVAVEASVSESQPESADVQSAEQVKEVSAEAPVEHAETAAEPEAVAAEATNAITTDASAVASAVENVTDKNENDFIPVTKTSKQKNKKRNKKQSETNVVEEVFEKITVTPNNTEEEIEEEKNRSVEQTTIVSPSEGIIIPTVISTLESTAAEKEAVKEIDYFEHIKQPADTTMATDNSIHSAGKGKKKNKKNKHSSSKTEQTIIDEISISKDALQEISTGSEAVPSSTVSPPIQVCEVSSSDTIENGVKETSETITITAPYENGDHSPTRFAQNVKQLVESTLKGTKHDMVNIDPAIKMQIDAQLVKLAEKKPVVILETKNVITPLPLQLHVSRPTTPCNRERMYKLLPKDIIFCSGLIDSYGENYAAMASDPRNIYKETARGLQRKIRIFKESPHYQTFLRAKEEGVPVEDLLAQEV